MSVLTEELIQTINRYAPRNLEEEWDNSGWQINLQKIDVEKVLITLEITNAVIEEAVSHKVDFILTHHPLIFSGIKSIDRNNPTGNYIVELIKREISVFSAHTSFDSAFGGINDDLAERVGLYKVRKLHAHIEDGETEDIIGRMGEYSSTKTLGEVCDLVKEALNMDKKLQVVGESDYKINRVAVCGGAGADAVPYIINHCDLLITGDVKHHTAQIAKESGLAIINAGHYATEQFFPENMCEKLSIDLGDRLDIIESTVNVEPFSLI